VTPVPVPSGSHGLGSARGKERYAAYRHLHEDARATLAAWSPPNVGQARLRDDVLAHLALGVGTVARSGPPTHLTAGCLLVDPEVEHVMLTLHRRAGRWFQFGGHLEPADDGLRAAAGREAREESGVDDLELLDEPVHLDRHELVGAFRGCREHLDVRYVAVADRGATPRTSEESLDVRWWPVGGLPRDTADELAPLVGAARAAMGRSD
jgi:8-oxo-dGTP pyrophosphatase MutT (NUDIX family)